MKVYLHEGSLGFGQDDDGIDEECFLFEIDNPLFNQIIKHKKTLYVLRKIDRKNNYCIVKRIKLEKDPIEVIYKSLITCPFCGHEECDSWEKTSDNGEIGCGNCGSEYYYTREIEVSYSTTPKKLNQDIIEVN